MSNLKNYENYDKIEVGIDEAGLGSVAGSFFAAAVILPKECPDNNNIELSIRQFLLTSLAGYNLNKAILFFCNIEQFPMDYLLQHLLCDRLFLNKQTILVCFEAERTSPEQI